MLAAPVETSAGVAAPKKHVASPICEASISSENSELSGNLSETSQEPAPGKDRSEEEWDEDAEEESAAGLHCRQKELSQPNCQTSPFDVRFSQMRARTEFRDGSSVEDAVSLIKAVRCPEREDGTGPVWRLEAPFPPIEVLQYRCKLRDDDGRPKLDPVTGGEMWDVDDHMFTLDNRRLYCYQKAAVALWPAKVVIDVIELPPQSLIRMRQVRKFRTMDSGESVLLGSRGDEDGQVRWSWRETVGLGAAPKKKTSDSEQESCYVKMRRRPRGEPRNGRGPSARKHHLTPNAAEKEDASRSFSKRFVTFLVLYLALRLGKNLFAASAGADRAAPETGVAAAHFTAAQLELEEPPFGLERKLELVSGQSTTPVLEAPSFQLAVEKNVSMTGVCAREAHLCKSLDSSNEALGSPVIGPLA
jgi:hypothetical protein